MDHFTLDNWKIIKNKGMVNLSGRMEAFMSVNLVKINETDEANI